MTAISGVFVRVGDHAERTTDPPGRISGYAACSVSGRVPPGSRSGVAPPDEYRKSPFSVRHDQPIVAPRRAAPGSNRRERRGHPAVHGHLPQAIPDVANPLAVW